MKKLLILLLITYTVIGNTQSERSSEQLVLDNTLRLNLIGHWKHQVATLPSGEQVNYNREFLLFADSTLIRRDITKIDTFTNFGLWTVIDTCVYLKISETDSTYPVLTDIVHIPYLDTVQMFLQSRFGDIELRKFSLYVRIQD